MAQAARGPAGSQASCSTLAFPRMLRLSNGVQLGPLPAIFFFFFQICSDLGVTVGPAFKVRRSSSEHTKSAGYSVISAAAQSRRPSPAFVPARRPKTTGPYYRLQSGPVNILPLGHAHQRRNAPERTCCSVRRSRSHAGEDV